MDSFELMKTLHVLAAVVWVGGPVTVQILGVRMLRADDPVRLAAFSKDIEWIGTRLYTPASLLVLLMGIGMVVQGGSPYFSDLWIILGLLGIAFSVIVGSTYLGPTSGKLGRLIEERGPDDPAAQQTIARILLVSRIELVVLMLVVIDMVVKPGA
jgi:uncharacterized membrane protein